MADFKVIVVGGGLAGLLLANGLSAAEINVEVYERMRDDVKRDGYQIRIAQPSFTSFEKLLSQEQNRRIRSKMGVYQDNQRTTPIWYDHQLNPLFDMGRFDSQYHGSAPMDRVILRDIMLEEPAARGLVKTGKGFSSYKILNPGEEKESVRVHFDDGTSADCDLLIGADGSHSKVNSAIGLTNLQTIPVLNFITKASLSVARLRQLPREAHQAPILVSSHRKTYFCVAYLPKQSEGEGDSAFDEKLATFTFSFLIPRDECPEGIRGWDSKEQWSFIADSIQDWHPTLYVYQSFCSPDLLTRIHSRQIIDAVRTEPLYVFEPRASGRPALNWREKLADPKQPELGHPRVWILGDALHAMLPNRGMGGNMAMFDTTVAVPLIQRLHDIAETSGRVSTTACAAACREFEAEMIPRAFRWVEDSGGFKAVPFDTNKYSGKLLAYSLNLSATLRELWTYIAAFFGSSRVRMD